MGFGRFARFGTTFFVGALAGIGLTVAYLQPVRLSLPNLTTTSPAPDSEWDGAGDVPARVLGPTAASPVDEVVDPSLDQILALIRSGRPSLALDRLEDLERRVSVERHLQARRAVLEELEAHLKRGELEPALVLARDYRRRYLHDATLLVLLAQIYERLGRVEDALAALFEVLEYPPSSEVADQVRDRIDLLERNHAAGLAQRREYHALVGFYATLLELAPGSDRYRLQQAQWLAEVEDYARAEELLAGVRDDTAAEVAALRARMEMGRAGIPVERHGDRLIAEARIANRGVRLLVDTGATMSSLSPTLLRRLGARLEDSSVLVMTASGTMTAPVFRVDELSIGERHFPNHRLLGLELEDAGVDGLLGMDVLGTTGLPTLTPTGHP